MIEVNINNPKGSNTLRHSTNKTIGHGPFHIELSTSFQGEFSRKHPVSWSQQQGSGNKLRLFPRFHLRDLRKVACILSRLWLPVSPFLCDICTNAHYIGKSTRALLFT